MSTVRIIQKFPPSNATPDIDYGIYTIPTLQRGAHAPQIANALRRNFSHLLSSPIESYNMACTQPQAGTIDVYLQHRSTYLARLREPKTTISSVEERVRILEERMKVSEERMKANEDIILVWETCDRLAQGLNDYIKSIITARSQDPRFRAAQSFWSDNDTRFRYLPHIFTQWCLYCNATNPHDFPTLPVALDLLTEREKSDLRCRPEFPLTISQAAQSLWDSEYRSLIDLMLVFYNVQPRAWNALQHPRPSAAFAYSHLSSNFQLSSEQDDIVRSIIDEGQIHEDGKWVPLFDHNTTAEV